MADETPERQGARGEPDRVTVLYVAGWGRSGSTLLELILATLPGFVATGELRRLWEAGLRRNNLCGCGARFDDCPFWSAVVGRVPRLADPARRRRLEGQARALARNRGIPGLLAGRGTATRPDRAAYLRALGQLYRSIRDEARANVVIDSSKSPAYGFLLASRPELDVRVIHLIRDSRAVAHSMSRHRVDPSDPERRPEMTRASPRKSALEWSSRNLLAAALRFSPARHARLRYEDLATDPAAATSRALGRLGLLEAATRATEIGEIALGENHTVAGNPLRFHRGPLAVQLDDAWRRSMAPGDRRWVSWMTWPFRW